MRLKSLALITLLSSIGSFAYANSDSQWLTINNNLLPIAQSQHAKLFSGVSSSSISSSVSIIKMDKNKLDQFSEQVNQQRGRCGGFMVHDSLEDALAAASTNTTASSYNIPSINQSNLVNDLLPQLDNGHIADMIRQQSSHYNRYYKSSKGEEASDQLKDTWTSLVKNLSFASIKQISNPFTQQSVELTLKGSKYPNEVIVIGAHLDSISGIFFHSWSKAPGADDDASGIASETEIIRVLAENQIQPERTIKFYGYAAEEGGLLGSKNVVNIAQNNHENDISALQLDMTNYKGSDKDFVFMTDYTDSNLTHFLETLSDTYLSSLTYDEDKCGYACSDHANWTKIGVPSVMPFESYMDEHDPYIHSRNDTLGNSDPTAMTALNFSKLGLVYLVESSFK